jgi:hypothetical protein
MLERSKLCSFYHLHVGRVKRVIANGGHELLEHFLSWITGSIENQNRSVRPRELRGGASKSEMPGVDLSAGETNPDRADD